MPEDFSDEPLGFECKAYRNTGNYASPVFSELKHTRNFNLGETFSEADSSRRGFGKEKVSRPARITREVTFQMLPKKSDPNYIALKSAKENRTFVEFFFMGGDITVAGETGTRGTFCVTNFSRNESDEDQVWIDVTLKVAPSEHMPEEYVVPEA